MKIEDQQTAQEQDLGFQIGEDMNLFELFAKGQEGSASKPVDLDVENDGTSDADKDKDKASPGAAAGSTKGNDKDNPDPGKDDNKEPEVDSDKLRELIAKDLKGSKEDQNDDGGKPSPKKDDEGGDTDTEDTPIAVVYNDFVEKGILDKLDDFDGTEEGLTAAVETTVNNRLAAAVDATIEEAFQKNPANADVAKDFIKHLGQGGTVSDFVTSRQDHGIKAEDLEAEDAGARLKVAKTILTQSYKEQGWDDARIKRSIERAEAKGEDFMVDEARDHLEEYQKLMKKKREDLTTATKAADDKRKKDLLDFNTKVSTSIDSVQEVAGFKLKDKKEREILKDYMFKPTVEHNGKKIPQFLADRLKYQNTPEFLMAQALWMKNGMKPDMKTAESKATSKLEEKLSSLQKGKKASGAQSASGQGTQNKTDKETPGILDFDNLEVISVK